MKLLLLLLPICAFGFDLPDRFVIKVYNKTEKEEPRYGQLSPEDKAKLTKAWGMNVDGRKARLERILKKAAKTMEKPSPDVKERIKNIVPLKTTKPPKGSVTDLFEVNNRLGLTDYYFQGDIHLSRQQLNEMERRLNGKTKRQASAFAAKWTANTVNFYFDASINDRKKASVRAAHTYLQAHTCINFVEDANAANRVKIYNGGGCSSAIGMNGGEQLLSLADGCEVIGTSAHEFAHALGIYHTQSRSDRNTYVDVDTSDVKPTAVGNFAQKGDNENFLYTPYEYGSFMHYSANAFTSRDDSFSIVPKDAKYMYTMGNRQISFYDIQMINYHYNCNVTCTAANSAVCQNGGYPNPRNCAECNCPQGYGGALCNQRPAGCGEELPASPDWQKKEFEFGEKNNQNVRDVFTMCHHWITAPQGKKIQVRITDMFNEQCQHACPYNGIEIKADASKEMVNPRFCCKQFNNQIIESKQNPTPVVSFNRVYYNTFEIEYRYIDDDVTTTTDAPTTTTTKTTTTTTTTEATTTTTEAMTTTADPVVPAKTTAAPAPATTVAPVVPTTTTTQAPPKNCVNALTSSQLPLLRFYNHAKLRHLFQFDRYETDLWLGQGYRNEGDIGKVIETNAYLRNKAEIDALCPGLVKLRTFVSRVGAQFMTADPSQAQWRLNNGWTELRPAGYCASSQSCGANKNLRLVSAHDGGNNLFTTDSYELGILNWQNPRYAGTLSNTICWLF